MTVEVCVVGVRSLADQVVARNGEVDPSFTVPVVGSRSAALAEYGEVSALVAGLVGRYRDLVSQDVGMVMSVVAELERQDGELSAGLAAGPLALDPGRR